MCWALALNSALSETEVPLGRARITVGEADNEQTDMRPRWGGQGLRLSGANRRAEILRTEAREGDTPTSMGRASQARRQQVPRPRGRMCFV